MQQSYRSASVHRYLVALTNSDNTAGTTDRKDHMDPPNGCPDLFIRMLCPSSPAVYSCTAPVGYVSMDVGLASPSPSWSSSTSSPTPSVSPSVTPSSPSGCSNQFASLVLSEQHITCGISAEATSTGYLFCWYVVHCAGLPIF
jgi:hypothetical protein